MNNINNTHGIAVQAGAAQADQHTLQRAGQQALQQADQQQQRMAGETADATQALAAETAQRQPLPQPNQFGSFFAMFEIERNIIVT